MHGTDGSSSWQKWERTAASGSALPCATHPFLTHTVFTQVGSEVGRRAKGLGLNVLAYDPYASSEKAAALVSAHTSCSLPLV